MCALQYDHHHHKSLYVCCVYICYSATHIMYGELAGLVGAYFKVYYLNQRRRMIYTYTREERVMQCLLVKNVSEKLCQCSTKQSKQKLFAFKLKQFEQFIACCIVFVSNGMLPALVAMYYTLCICECDVYSLHWNRQAVECINENNASL